ncbi:MAG: ABC transporter permease subunit, partial [Clostridia bacterium]|nr:ABC transporter permease subunit [Clostridia bacterium]
VVSYVLPVVAKTLSPIVVILRSVPTMSSILLALIWLDSKSAPILIAFLILFPQLYSSFLSALNGVSEELIDMSKAYKVPVFKRIMGLYIPEILPSSLDAMKSSVSFGVKITIAGEVLAQTFNSMGVSMQISKSYFDTAELLGWTIMAILLSYGLEGVFSLIKYFAVRRKV